LGAKITPCLENGKTAQVDILENNEVALKFQVLPIPDKTTQQNIASILSSLDSEIELNNGINAELEVMAKTLYDYWFVQFEFPDENGKPYKTSGGKIYLKLKTSNSLNSATGCYLCL
jgi:restriction endonuclease S subunit